MTSVAPVTPGTTDGDVASLPGVPLPSCAAESSPQHSVWGPLIAQLNSSPEAIAEALVRPGIWVGVEREVVVPSPSWPLLLLPQQ